MIGVWILRFFGLFGKGMRVLDKQVVRIADTFGDGDRILDLGGGGAGIIGLLRGAQVYAVDKRQSELDESPAGPNKILADAKELPFPDAYFDAATAFFFLMYVLPADRQAILMEAYRVLKPGASLRVWDVTIPQKGANKAAVLAVPVKAILPRKTVNTAYGVQWAPRTMSCEAVAAEAVSAGFKVKANEITGQTFYLELTR